MVDNSEIISLMQRMDHLAHSILQFLREFQALLDGVLAKANLLWYKIDSAPSAWDIPIEHSKHSYALSKHYIRIVHPFQHY